MTANAMTQLAVYLLLLLLLAWPLGAYIARVFSNEATLAQRVLGPLERGLQRVAGVSHDDEMPWYRYAVALLLFNFVGLAAVYVLQRCQGALPLNPMHFPGVEPGVAFNTAVSFASNTNWQAYSGETTMSHGTQMIALAVQNFLSAATGLAVLVALLRGVARRNATTIGSFWVDLIKATVYILLPLSLLLALFLVSQGVVQTFAGTVHVQLLQASVDGNGQPVTEQILALGPVASQLAIKQLGTNGGGFFNVNSAHPFENPTALSNLLQMLALLLIPAALCFTFGRMIRDKRQAWAVIIAMMLIFVPITVVTMVAEQRGNPSIAALGVTDVASDTAPGGNMEGKEVRFGITDSAIWATATTAASNGSVNSMHDSYSALGGLGPLWMMQLGEIIFGGVGSGLYGMLMYVIVAVFIAGLMVGRTPEYLGKKIEAFEMKMAALVILIPSAAVLVGTAVAVSTRSGTGATANPGAHGFSEILYAFSSGANNNGSAFGGLTVNGTFYSFAIGICMLIGRYWVIIPVLAVAGSLARKKITPPSAGTLPTHTPLFVLLLVFTILLVGALTFVPALALGPIVEHVGRL